MNSKSGHKVAECPEPRSAADVECRKCGESRFPVPLLARSLWLTLSKLVTSLVTALRAVVAAAVAVTATRKAIWPRSALSR